MSLPADLEEAVARVAAVERLLACWDFDGTLAPIVSDPQAARPLPGSVDLLGRLAGLRDTQVALLSGRARVDLARLSGAREPIVLVGSHGAELPDGLGDGLHPSSPERLREVVAAVGAITADVPGVLLEAKPVSVAVHVRNVADRAAAQKVVDEVIAGPGGWPGVHITTGKEVVELSVRRVDKGAAITALRGRFAASAVIFVGDDVTDERGFAVLQAGDVGVKVGAGASGADYRVESPERVLDLIAALVGARGASSRR